jgi:hypothetical protein
MSRYLAHIAPEDLIEAMQRREWTTVCSHYSSGGSDPFCRAKSRHRSGCFPPLVAMMKATDAG